MARQHPVSERVAAGVAGVATLGGILIPAQHILDLEKPVDAGDFFPGPPLGVANTAFGAFNGTK
jgi:hypothetical protein